MDKVGHEIKRLRDTKGWTGAQLAVYAKMSPSAVSQIETGQRSPNTASLAKLAKALGVEVADLFPKASAPSPESKQGRRSSALSSVLTRVMKATVDSYVLAVADPSLKREQAFVILAAARVLEDHISTELGVSEVWGQLSAQDKHDVTHIMQRIEEVETLYRLRMEDAMKPEELDTHLEKSVEAWK